jgi:hypothetical protein
MEAGAEKDHCIAKPNGVHLTRLRRLPQPLNNGHGQGSEKIRGG